ncbi:DNA topoisomerase IB [Roseateles amylovorans]|uniref:DNA topoisomerase n=1 Tax=Roseateles amylovorans TaxID=2978473 RepID=A0ABY6B5T4_9BURK|nr:DNA topoisomerase IB [Roseateles amylovorans]UXH80529.1 DNA topoisomerase IB [Roseateles amylovorans]
MSLRWVSDCEPGLRRQRAGKGFRYIDASGRSVRDPEVLRRIRALAIPPAYEQVWICAREDGHIQATARDAKGRKQYRYHADWMALRGDNKFGSLTDFAAGLPRLRRQVQRRLGDRGLGRDRVIAALVRLLDRTWMRIGHREYARTNGSYGLSTLLCRHVKVSGDALLLSFVGKSGVRHQLAVKDERVAALVRHCRDLPGQELFGYEDEQGEPHRIDASDVNDWLARVGSPTCSAKVFRTWHASVLALDLLQAQARAGRAPAAALKDVLTQVAGRLGNTVAVCRKSYVHPAVIDWASADQFDQLPVQPWMREPPSVAGLSVPERRLIGLLRATASAQVGAAASAAVVTVTASPAPSPSHAKRDTRRRSAAGRDAAQRGRASGARAPNQPTTAVKAPKGSTKQTAMAAT